MNCVEMRGVARGWRFDRRGGRERGREGGGRRKRRGRRGFYSEKEEAKFIAEERTSELRAAFVTNACTREKGERKEGGDRKGSDLSSCCARGAVSRDCHSVMYQDSDVTEMRRIGGREKGVREERREKRGASQREIIIMAARPFTFVFF